MLNTEFTDVNSSNVKDKYDELSKVNEDDFNVISYISSHDGPLFQPRNKDGAVFLLLAPGAVQMLYGGEICREDQGEWKKIFEWGAYDDLICRSFMNWENLDKGNSEAVNMLNPWQKI